MAEFYYEDSSEKSAHPIDRKSQQILIYLASYTDSTVENLVERVNVASKSEVDIRIREYLGSDAARLVCKARTDQATLGDREPPSYYTLTEEGERFVAENKASMSMPSDFKEVSGSIRELRTDVTEIRDSMHRLDADELSDELTMLAERLDSIQEHLSKYD